MLNDKIKKMIPYVNSSLDKHLKYIEILLDNYTHFEINNLQKKYVINVFSKLIYNKDQNAFAPNDNFEKVATNFVDSQLRMSLSHILEMISPVRLCVILNKLQLRSEEFKNIKNYILSHIHKLENQETKQINFIEFMIGKKKEIGETQKNKDLPIDIDDNLILQQSLTFFLTAFETISSVLSFVLYELAYNQNIQNKCIDEINKSFGINEDYSLESLNKLKYLQMVIDEALRKHTLAQMIDRKCKTKYTFPGTELTIDKGINVFVPIHGLHNDPKYFPNPEKFDPTRFSEEKKAHISQYVYMPFGDGPRTCIGHRLAKIVILIGISGFLQRYKVSPPNKIDNKLRYDPRRIRNIAPLGGIWLVIEKRKN